MAVAHIKLTAPHRQPDDFEYLAALVENHMWRAARELRRSQRVPTRIAQLNAKEARLLLLLVEVEADTGCATAARLLPTLQTALERTLRAEAEEASRIDFVSTVRPVASKDL